MRWLLALYPRRWRDRYGHEMSQLVDDLRPTSTRARIAVAFDLLVGAWEARVSSEGPVESRHPTGNPLWRGVLVALVVWVGLSVEIVLSNVVFPSRDDNDAVSVLISYLCVFVALGMTGIFVARTGRDWRAAAAAGAVAGALIGALTIGTFFFVDNVFLDTISQQQSKIDGLARSGQTSMRAYVNTGLAGAAVGLTIFFSLVGAVLAAVAGYASRPQDPSRAR